MAANSTCVVVFQANVPYLHLFTTWWSTSLSPLALDETTTNRAPAGNAVLHEEDGAFLSSQRNKNSVQRRCVQLLFSYAAGETSFCFINICSCTCKPDYLLKFKVVYKKDVHCCIFSCGKGLNHNFHKCLCHLYFSVFIYFCFMPNITVASTDRIFVILDFALFISIFLC